MDKNITTLLTEIRSGTGWSEPRIAKEIGTSQPTVNRILNGQDDCRGKTLKAIVDLHKRVCVDAAEKVNSSSASRRSKGKKNS